MLAVPSFDVHFRFFSLRIENRSGRIRVFDDFAQQHEDALVRGSTGLSHVVRHDDDGVLLAQAGDQFLDSFDPFGVQCRAGFVHQDHAWLQRQQAGNAQLLLLFQRQPVAFV